MAMSICQACIDGAHSLCLGDQHCACRHKETIRKTDKDGKTVLEPKNRY